MQFDLESGSLASVVNLTYDSSMGRDLKIGMFSYASMGTSEKEDHTFNAVRSLLQVLAIPEDGKLGALGVKYGTVDKVYFAALVKSKTSEDAVLAIAGQEIPITVELESATVGKQKMTFISMSAGELTGTIVGNARLSPTGDTYNSPVAKFTMGEGVDELTFMIPMLVSDKITFETVEAAVKQGAPLGTLLKEPGHGAKAVLVRDLVYQGLESARFNPPLEIGVVRLHDGVDKNKQPYTWIVLDSNHIPSDMMSAPTKNNPESVPVTGNAIWTTKSLAKTLAPGSNTNTAFRQALDKGFPVKLVISGYSKGDLGWQVDVSLKSGTAINTYQDHPFFASQLDLPAQKQAVAAGSVGEDLDDEIPF
jgi:hypothetical protein